jgi:hypothetical protein
MPKTVKFELRAVRHLAPFGIWCRSAFGAVRHLAPFGIWRRSAFGAVRHLAPFGTSRRQALRARSALCKEPSKMAQRRTHLWVHQLFPGGRMLATQRIVYRTCEPVVSGKEPQLEFSTALPEPYAPASI